MFSCILFDLDGTISDPKQGICGCVQYALRSFGIEEPELDRLEPFIGPPLSESFMKYYNFTAEQAQEAVEKYRERFSVTGKYENVLYPGMGALLHDLKASGATLAIASSKPTVYVEDILVHFGIREYFDIVVGSELDGRRVHKEEVVAEVLSQLAARGESDPDKMVMIGDRSFDVEGAKAIGAHCIAVSYGYAQPGELENAGAEIIVRDVEGLRSVLLGGTQAGSSTQAGNGTQSGSSAQAGNGTQAGSSTQAGSGTQAGSSAQAGRSVQTGNGTQAGSSAATGPNTLSERYRGSAARMKTKSGQFWSAVGTSALAMFTYYVISLIISGVILTAVSVVYAIGLQELEGSSYNFWLNVASALSTFGAFIICYGIWHKKIQFHSTKEIDKLSIVPMVILAAAIAIGMNGVLTLTELYRFSPTFQRVSEMQFDTPVWLGIISYGILAPLGEEIVFRGVVYGQLRKVLKVPYAVVLSGLAFGLFHGNLVQAVYATVIGCLLALVYEWYGTIAAPMLFHSVANLFVYVMLELLPFGGVFLSVPSCVLFLALSAGSLFLLWTLQGKAASRQNG